MNLGENFALEFGIEMIRFVNLMQKNAKFDEIL